MSADRIPLSPPQIPAVSSQISRPLWSVMIPVFNCSKFLKTAIESVLIQDIDVNAMQIEVVDDCSTDTDVKQLVERVGQGRVSYYRQEKNVGSLRNFETCIKRATGKYIHLLHGDDCIKAGFYQAVDNLFVKFPNVGAACCAFDLIDERGEIFYSSIKEAQTSCILSDWLYKLAERPRLQFVCIVVKREVYENLGSFFLVTFGEDWEMWARIAKHYATAYTPETLAQYRIHENSISANGIKNSSNLKSLKIVIDKITSYLAKKDKKKYERRASKYCASIYITQIVHQYSRDKDLVLFKHRLTEVLNLNASVKLIMKVWLIKLFALLPFRWFAKFYSKI